MSKKHSNPLKYAEYNANYVREQYMNAIFLWNAYSRDVLNDAQYEAGMVLATDGWTGTAQDLVEAARRLA